MKKYLFILIAVISIIGCSSDKKADKNSETTSNPDGKAKFEFVEEVHDFGEIVQGERVSYTFKFKNIGEADLIINSVKASCGCTAPDFDKEPVAPGEEGNINVTFDSSNREGNQYKKITVDANTEPQIHELVITCNVVKP